MNIAGGAQSRNAIIEARVIAGVVVVLDKGADLPFEIARQVVVIEQDAVLEGLMPALDLALRLRVIRRTPHMLHALVCEPFASPRRPSSTMRIISSAEYCRRV